MPALRRSALLIGVFAAAFVGVTLVVAAGGFHSMDRSVAHGMADIYVPWLLGLFRAIALLGGIEMTWAIGLGLFIYLRRHGYRRGSLAAGAVVLATIAETFYKRVVGQPGPPLNLSHPDGPSFSDLVERAGFAASYPSGHMTRTVVAYGLLAFVVHRLTRREWARRAALPAFLVVVVLMVIDRLYLGVHWESDVIGGLLLGTTVLAAAITWLEWSESVRNE
ncbi:MAG: phosphatase PAP2 family protein [Candidatus Dormibacteraeota bacterium]|nr:phosphatase PAP2 family protein [Candidatus Dormibacteraeota bacterium]